MALKHKTSILAIGAVALLSICGWLIYTKIDAKDWAAWVQAVGSIAAIVFAIALTWYQGEASIEREKIKEAEEVKGLLLSIRDELNVSMQMAQLMVGDQLEQTERGTGFYATFPVQEDPFNIFNSVSNRLPMIKNETLRLQIIKTYGIAKGAIGTFHQNNALVAEYESVWRAAQKSGSAAEQDDAKRVGDQVVRYGDSVRDHYAQIKIEVAELFSLLREIDM